MPPAIIALLVFVMLEVIIIITVLVGLSVLVPRFLPVIILPVELLLRERISHNV